MRSQRAASQLRYAGIGSRFVALVIDMFVLSLVFFPATKAVKGVWVMSRGDHLWGYGWMVTDPLCVTFLLVIVSYFVLMEGALGMTVGKGLLGLRVVRLDGGTPGLIPALIRNLLRIVDALPVLNILGVVLIVSSAERARFGDRIARPQALIKKCTGELRE